MDLGLKDRVIMVAAASKGLGYGIAEAVSKDGARVSICSRNQDDIVTAAATLSEGGAQVISTPCDVTRAVDIQRWVSNTLNKWGRIDGLVVNAGGPPAALFKEITEEQWYGAFELTLMSSVRMIQAALPHMQAGSAILTITSSSIREPIPRLALSTVMRAGVAGLVKTLADELADDGIRVNNLIPGRIDTDRVRQLDELTANKQGISFDEARNNSLTKIPLGRLGTIQDFGQAGAYLLSPAASYITGASLRVDGGAMRMI